MHIKNKLVNQQFIEFSHSDPNHIYINFIHLFLLSSLTYHLYFNFNLKKHNH